jgi:hypothetical protein
MMQKLRAAWILPLLILTGADAPPASPTTAPTKLGKLPHIQVDVKAKQVRVDCEAVKADYPLEFLAVVTNTNEYEALVRTEAKPSDLHLALLMIGLTPGMPVRYSESTKSWLPPSGPPVDIWFEYQKNGKQMKLPAYRWMRDVQSKKEAPPMAWVFTGSKVMNDHSYAADASGSLVSVINNERAVLDVPALKSGAIESREYERNSELMPPTGTAVTMILSPASDLGAPGAGTPGAGTPSAGRADTSASAMPGATTVPVGLSDVHIDQAKVDRLRQHWEDKVAPHRQALREAAQAHYQVINDLRKEQQRLIDESDRIQRTIDQLEKEYQDMTTPQPEPGQ